MLSRRSLLSHIALSVCQLTALSSLSTLKTFSSGSALVSLLLKFDSSQLENMETGPNGLTITLSFSAYRLVWAEWQLEESVNV